MKTWQWFVCYWIIQRLQLLSASRDTLMIGQFQKKLDVFQSDMELLKFDMSNIQHSVSNLNKTCHCKENDRYFENADMDANSSELVNRQFTDNITGIAQTLSRFSDSEKTLFTGLLKALKDEKKHTRAQLDKMLGTIEEVHNQEKIFQTEIEERYNEHEKHVKQMESSISKTVEDAKTVMKQQTDTEIETLKHDLQAVVANFNAHLRVSQQEKTAMKVEFDNKHRADNEKIDQLKTLLKKNEQEMSVMKQQTDTEIKTLKHDLQALLANFNAHLSASQQEKNAMKVEFDNKFRAYRENVDKLKTVLNTKEQEMLVMKEYISKQEVKMNHLTFLVDKQKDMDYCLNPSDSDKWTPSKEFGSSFLVVGTPLTWQQAQEFCRNLCSYLVELTTTEKQTLIKNLYSSKAVSTKREFWTGGNDLETEGKWKWYHSGLSINRGFRNWRDTEPNNSQGKEDCLGVKTDSFEWNDLKCSNECPFVCERSLKIQ